MVLYTGETAMSMGVYDDLGGVGTGHGSASFLQQHYNLVHLVRRRATAEHLIQHQLHKLRRDRARARGLLFEGSQEIALREAAVILRAVVESREKEEMCASRRAAEYRQERMTEGIEEQAA